MEKLFSTREVGEFRSMVDQISALRGSISKLDRMLGEKFVSGCKKKKKNGGEQGLLCNNRRFLLFLV